MNQTDFKKLVETVRGRFHRGNYDASDLLSAMDHYGIAARDWNDIIYFEDGALIALNDLLEMMRKPEGNT